MRSKLTILCSLAALALPAQASAVVGGQSVPSGRYAYAVAVGGAKGADCGGTLIAPSVVLTAAHCVAGDAGDPSVLRVVAGSPTITGAPTLRVASVSVHPLFRAATMHYDAALLFLEQPVSGIRPIAMAGSSPLAGALVSAAGWGETNEHATALPDHLRSVVLTVEPKRACARGNDVPGGYFTASMMCASKPGRDTCWATAAARSSAAAAGRPSSSGSRASASAARGPGIPASTPACRRSAAGRSGRSPARSRSPARRSARGGRVVGKH